MLFCLDKVDVSFLHLMVFIHKLDIFLWFCVLLLTSTKLSLQKYYIAFVKKVNSLVSIKFARHMIQVFRTSITFLR